MKEFYISIKDCLKETLLVVMSNKPAFGFHDAVHQMKTAYYEGVRNDSRGWRILEESEHGSYRTLLDKIPGSFLNKNNIFVVTDGKPLHIDATVSMDDILMEHNEFYLWEKIDNLNPGQICNWLYHTAYMYEEITFWRNPLRNPRVPCKPSNTEVYEILDCTYLQRDNDSRDRFI